jgi:protein SCO1/2
MSPALARGSRTARRLATFAMAAAVITACSAKTPAAAAKATIGGDFALTDHNKQRFELQSLRGKVVMIFFGYSMCPDVCPTTLSKLTRVAMRLGSDSTKVKTLYITVDPDRDTPDVLKADLSLFRLDALGLTGTRAEIDKVVAQYGAKYQIVQTPQSAGKYSVSHSTTLYVLDGKGVVQQSFPYEATVDEIVAGLRPLITEVNAGK